IESIKPLDDSLADRKITAAGKAGGDNAFPKSQRLRCPDGNRGKPKFGDADEAEVVRQTARLDLSDPTFRTMRDFDGFCFARDMAGGREEVGRDDDARADALRTVGGDCADLDEALRKVVSSQRSGRYDGHRGGSEPQQPSQRSLVTLRVSHARCHCRKQAIELLRRSMPRNNPLTCWSTTDMTDAGTGANKCRLEG